MSDRWIIDRIEGDLAIVQAGALEFEVPLNALPAGAHEGQVLSVQVDIDATTATREAAAARLAALAGEDDGGDFSL